MNKLNRILIGVLALQLVLLVVTWTRGGDLTSVAQLEPLVAIDAEAVSKVQIFDSVKPGADAVVGIALEKRGDRWLLTSHHDYPADDTAVTGIIGKLAAMAARAPTTSNPDKHGQLEVAGDHYRRKVVLGGSGGDVEVYLGAETGFRQTAVRVGNADDVYTVAALSARELSMSAADWIDPVYFELDPARVASLTIENSRGTVTLSRSGEAWELAPESIADGAAASQPPAQPTTLAASKVEALLQAATGIDITDIAAGAAEPAHGFDSPTARITLAIAAAPDGTEPQETFVIEVGATAGASYLVRTLDRKHVVEVPMSKLKSLVEADRAGLTSSATPAPKPTSPIVTPRPGRP